MSAKEKEAAAEQTFTFLAPLTNEQSCEADIYFSDGLTNEQSCEADVVYIKMAVDI